MTPPSGNELIRNGQFVPPASYTPAGWSDIYFRDLNNHGTILAEATRTLDDEGLPITNPQPEPILLVPMQVDFVAVGDADPVSENRNPSTHAWMVGQGLRIFPDSKTPTETTPRNLVQLKITTGLPNHDVYLRLFDVDDPSTDLIIDPNDTEDIGQGDDNLTPATISGGVTVAPAPPYFYINNTRSFTCRTDSEGVARLINGSLPVIVLGMQPGDNLRAAVSLLSETDLAELQVVDPTINTYVSPSDEQPYGFTGTVSTMLTIWRKLHIEIDSMDAGPPVSGSESNNITGSITNYIADLPDTGKATLTINTTLPDGVDRFQYGLMDVPGFGGFQVIGNTDNLLFNDNLVIDEMPGSAIISKTYTLTDDDDSHLNEANIPPPLPQDGNSSSIINAIQSKYAICYIEIADANTIEINPDSRVPFKLNEEVMGIGPLYASHFDDTKNLIDSNSFWSHTVIFGYQSDASNDGDPNYLPPLQGGTPKTGALHNESRGYSVIYMEANREVELGHIVPGLLINSTYMSARHTEYYNLLYGTIAHEIGHSPGAQWESTDHNEEGLMGTGGAKIQRDFLPPTILRFRKTKSWSQ